MSYIALFVGVVNDDSAVNCDCRNDCSVSSYLDDCQVNGIFAVVYQAVKLIVDCEQVGFDCSN